MSSRQEQINALLDRLQQNVSAELTGIVAVSLDGIVLATRVTAETNADRVGAVAATLIGVARRVASELKLGTTEEAILKASSGYFLVLPAGTQALLAVALRAHANLGMVRIEAREAANGIGSVLES
jgi:uncharacterized protein